LLEGSKLNEHIKNSKKLKGLVNTMKKSLFSAALMLVFSVTMLLGTTYAWWSETIVVKDNALTTGKLEMRAEYRSTSKPDNPWTDFESGKSLFEYVNNVDQKKYIEPGFEAGREVRITNDGTIPMAFKVFANHGTAQYNGGTRETDEELANAVNVKVSLGSRQLYSGSLPDGLSSPYIVLQPGEDITFTVELSIPTTVENAEDMGLFFPITFQAEQLGKVKTEDLFNKFLQPTTVE
jgi:hypothetical protein